MIHKVLYLTVFCVLMGVPLSGQDTLSTEASGQDTLSTEATESELPIVAIMDFIQKGTYPYEITILEAQTLTNEFAAQVIQTGKVTLYDQAGMREVMDQKGFVSSECTDPKCVRELGQLLQVAFVINGNVEKVDSMFTVNAFMVDVAADSIKREKNVVHVGEVDGFITEIEILAWEILGLPPPNELLRKRDGEMAVVDPSEKTRMGALTLSAVLPGLGQLYLDNPGMGYVWMGSEIVVGVLAYMSFTRYKTAYDDMDYYFYQYTKATNPDEAREFRILSKQAELDETTAKDEIQSLIVVGAGLWVANMVHAYMSFPKPKAASAAPQKTAFDLVYNQKLMQPQLRFSIALD